jgi:hypothetical protein
MTLIFQSYLFCFILKRLVQRSEYIFNCKCLHYLSPFDPNPKNFNLSMVHKPIGSIFNFVTIFFYKILDYMKKFLAFVENHALFPTG